MLFVTKRLKATRHLQNMRKKNIQQKMTMIIVYPVISVQKVYTSKSSLTRHKKSKHPNEDVKQDAVHACEYCEKVFESRSGMMRHAKVKHASEVNMSVETKQENVQDSGTLS